MTPTDLDGITDILPLAQPSPWPALTAALFIMLLALLLFLSFRFFDPLRKIERQLRGGKIGARQAAHRLARHARHKPRIAGRLDRLRFARKPPDPAELLRLIEALRD